MAIAGLTEVVPCQVLELLVVASVAWVVPLLVVAEEAFRGRGG